jgi:hypothetical protein
MYTPVYYLFPFICVYFIWRPKINADLPTSIFSSCHNFGVGRKLVGGSGFFFGWLVKLTILLKFFLGRYLPAARHRLNFPPRLPVLDDYPFDALLLTNLGYYTHEAGISLLYTAEPFEPLLPWTMDGPITPSMTPDDDATLKKLSKGQKKKKATNKKKVGN